MFRTYMVLLIGLFANLTPIVSLRSSAADEATGSNSRTGAVSSVSFGANLLDVFERNDDISLHKRVESMFDSSGAQVRTKAQAMSNAMSLSLPMDAMEKVEINGLFRLGRDVPALGKQGQLLWQAQRVRLDPQGVVASIWVNATTGKAVDVFSLFGGQ